MNSVSPLSNVLFRFISSKRYVLSVPFRKRLEDILAVFMKEPFFYVLWINVFEGNDICIRKNERNSLFRINSPKIGEVMFRIPSKCFAVHQS